MKPPKYHAKICTYDRHPGVADVWIIRTDGDTTSGFMWGYLCDKDAADLMEFFREKGLEIVEESCPLLIARDSMSKPFGFEIPAARQEQLF